MQLRGDRLVEAGGTPGHLLVASSPGESRAPTGDHRTWATDGRCVVGTRRRFLSGHQHSCRRPVCHRMPSMPGPVPQSPRGPLQKGARPWTPGRGGGMPGCTPSSAAGPWAVATEGVLIQWCHWVEACATRSALTGPLLAWCGDPSVSTWQGAPASLGVQHLPARPRWAGLGAARPEPAGLQCQLPLQGTLSNLSPSWPLALCHLHLGAAPPLPSQLLSQEGLAYLSPTSTKPWPSPVCCRALCAT